ncbi:MAG: Veg family protein [Clostridiales bacterium]|nr:Veg family protein [Eubacteriales bacterium]MCI7095566.1 Veg family protein [Clostridiales bacterium]MDD6053998.1 Veg family protein [Clostridiales bacterium]MDD7506037.1 Veg family protein [Clostridiales bacterium]MDY5678121.1 Veg family protein [Eubacteriales bacterium]
MRKKTMDVDLAKKKVESLMGKELKIRYNKGRNKIVYFDGKISEFYNNVFVITVYNEIFDRISCSYTDLLCGDVAFLPKSGK